MYMQTTFGVSTHQYNGVGSEIYKRRIHSSNELNALCWRISTQIHLIRNTSSLPDVEKRLWCGVVPTCQSKDKNQFHLRYNGLLIYYILDRSFQKKFKQLLQPWRLNYMILALNESMKIFFGQIHSFSLFHWTCLASLRPSRYAS